VAALVISIENGGSKKTDEKKREILLPLLLGIDSKHIRALQRVKKE
jgi:hypothetical protein